MGRFQTTFEAVGRESRFSLLAQGWLPTLIFNFVRSFCEKMAGILVEHFETEDAASKN
jgi:hypothetical protein